METMLKQRPPLFAPVRRDKPIKNKILPPIAWLRYFSVDNYKDTTIAYGITAGSLATIGISALYSFLIREHRNKIPTFPLLFGKVALGFSSLCFTVGTIMITGGSIVMLKREKREHIFRRWKEKAMYQSLNWTQNLDNKKEEEEKKKVDCHKWKLHNDEFHIKYKPLQQSILFAVNCTILFPIFIHVGIESTRSIVTPFKNNTVPNLLRVIGAFSIAIGLPLLIKTYKRRKWQLSYIKHSQKYQYTTLERWKQLSKYIRPSIEDWKNINIVKNNNNIIISKNNDYNITTFIHFYALRSIVPLLNVQVIETINRDYYLKTLFEKKEEEEEEEKRQYNNNLLFTPSNIAWSQYTIPSRTNKTFLVQSQDSLDNKLVIDLLAAACGLTSLDFKKQALEEDKKEDDKKQQWEMLLDRKIHTTYNIGDMIFISLNNNDTFINNRKISEIRLCILWSPLTINKKDNKQKNNIGTIVWQKLHNCCALGIRIIPNCISFIFVGNIDDEDPFIIKDNLIRLSDGESVINILRTFPNFESLVDTKRFNSIVCGENDGLSHEYNAHVSYDQKWIALHFKSVIHIYEVERLLYVPLKNIVEAKSTADVIISPVHSFKFIVNLPFPSVRNLYITWLHDFHFETCRNDFEGFTYGRAGCWLISYNNYNCYHHNNNNNRRYEQVYLIDGRDGSIIHEWNSAIVTSFIQRDLMGYYDSRFTISIRQPCSCNHCLNDNNTLCETIYYNIEAWTLSNAAFLNTCINTNEGTCITNNMIQTSRINLPSSSRMLPKYIWLSHTYLMSDINDELSLYFTSVDQSFYNVSSLSLCRNYINKDMNNMIQYAQSKEEIVPLHSPTIFRPVIVPEDFLYAASEWITLAINNKLQGSLDLLAIVFSYYF